MAKHDIYMVKIWVVNRWVFCEVDENKQMVYFGHKWYPLDNDGNVKIGFETYKLYDVQYDGKP
jgi:hypothetical protein